ncbi:MAG: bifunctional metallophosphatase/5'-nucleotidase [Gilvibacter sp.]
MRSIIGFFITGLLLSSCSATKTAGSSKKDDGQITFKVIQLNDVYEIAPLGGGLYGGLSRVAHVRDSLLAIQPNTYTVMAGDFLNPSLIGTLKLDGERIYGAQMIEVLNAIGVDLLTFGNHEFDIGQEALQKRLNESNSTWISANVRQNTENGTSPFAKVRDIGILPLKDTYTLPIKDSDGTMINVGFFSVTIDSNPQDFVSYLDPFTASEKAVSVLDPTTEVIIGLTHLKVSDDVKLANRHKAIDFIMGGHEHNSMLVPTDNAIVAKADANAKTIYIHTFTYNKSTQNLSVDSHLLPIDNTITSQPMTKAIVDKWSAILRTKIMEVIDDPDAVIYQADTPLDGTDSASRGIQTNLGGIITAAMAKAYSNEVAGAIVNGGSIRIDDLLSGPVNSVDIFRVLPFGGSALKVSMTGSLLKEVLDYGWSSAGTGAYLQHYNLTKDAQGAWQVGGQPIDPEKVYELAVSDFLLKGFDIPFLTPDNPGVLGIYEPKANEMAYDIRKAVIDYLKNK